MCKFSLKRYWKFSLGNILANSLENKLLSKGKTKKKYFVESKYLQETRGMLEHVVAACIELLKLLFLPTCIELLKWIENYIHIYMICMHFSTKLWSYDSTKIKKSNLVEKFHKYHVLWDATPIPFNLLIFGVHILSLLWLYAT